MRRLVCLLLVVVGLLCGCVRSEETDLVLFCESFNEKASFRIMERDALRRSETEWILSVNELLIRLQTASNASIEAVIITSPANNVAALVETAQCAFDVLAQCKEEKVPHEIVKWVSKPSNQVEIIDTEHFRYLCYASSDAITLQQLPLPSVAPNVQPSLRR